MAAITDFSKLVVIALAQSLKYLSSFNVADALRETRFFGKFTERTHMLLNANTLTNLYAYGLWDTCVCDTWLIRCYAGRSTAMTPTLQPRARSCGSWTGPQPSLARAC